MAIKCDSWRISTGWWICASFSSFSRLRVSHLATVVTYLSGPAAVAAAAAAAVCHISAPALASSQIKSCRSHEYKRGVSPSLSPMQAEDGLAGCGRTSGSDLYGRQTRRESLSRSDRESRVAQYSNIFVWIDQVLGQICVTIFQSYVLRRFLNLDICISCVSLYQPFTVNLCVFLFGFLYTAFKNCFKESWGVVRRSRRRDDGPCKKQIRLDESQFV